MSKSVVRCEGSRYTRESITVGVILVRAAQVSLAPQHGEDDVVPQHVEVPRQHAAGVRVHYHHFVHLQRIQYNLKLYVIFSGQIQNHIYTGAK